MVSEASQTGYTQMVSFYLSHKIDSLFIQVVICLRVQANDAF